MSIARIVYVLKKFPKLSETFIAREIAELRRRGVAVRILSLARPNEMLRHTFVDEAGLLELVEYDQQCFADVVRRFRPALLHAHFATEATALAWRLSRELHVPFSFTAHRYDIYDMPPGNFCARAAAAASVITVSQANARHIAQMTRCPLERIHVIPCGVPVDWFVPTAHAPTVPPTIVCVARLERVKQLATLLAACTLLQKSQIDFQCVVIGGGACEEELHEMCQRFGVAQRVRFLGPLDAHEVRQWWQQACIAVLTSSSEGMPVSLMEAAACGVPAVATRVGGIPEFVVDGATGILVDPGNVLELAAALERLLVHPDLAARYGRAARQRAVEVFSLERQVDSLLHVWASSFDSFSTARASVAAA